MIRFLDFIFSLLGIILLFPVFLVLYFAVRLESKGGGFYKQLRVGRGGTDFLKGCPGSSGFSTEQMNGKRPKNGRYCDGN